MGNGNSFFLSRCLTDASLAINRRGRKRKGAMKVQRGGLRAEMCQSCTPTHPRSSLDTHFKRNVLNIGQISLLCQLTFLHCLTSALLPTSSGWGPLYLSCPDQLLNYLLSSPTGFCSKSTQPRASKLVAGIHRSKCNFPEQEGGENLNAS